MNKDKHTAQRQTISGLKLSDFDSAIDGKQTRLYTLQNGRGMEVCITNYGGRVVSIVVPDKDGNPVSVVAGFDNIAQYADTINDASDYGASVGRYANRIKGGCFTLLGTTYQLRQNDGVNTLHGGGTTGWMNRVFDAEQVSPCELRLTIIAEDGENGFPGTVTAVTTYRITSDNTLDITWEATTDKPTIICQTNHNYYNLSGNFANTVLDQILYVNADTFTPSDEQFIPTGEVRSVKNTPMDFSKPHAIGECIYDDYDQIRNARGYDHNYCLNTYRDGMGHDDEVCAALFSPATGIYMEMFTNEPGLHVYSANMQGVGKQAQIPRRHGTRYLQHCALCLESQKFPDSPNHSEWVQPTLLPGERYYSHAAYRFSIREKITKQ